jgi:hypothetical protein
MHETISKAVKENESKELEYLIKDTKWKVDYHTTQAETSRIQLRAYQVLKQKLEGEL